MIIIAPYAANPPGMMGKHPKNYPYWKEVISEIKEDIIQVGVSGESPLVSDFRPNLSLDELSELLSKCRTWISVDSFFQHWAWKQGKPGVVIFSQSDPLIFGHPENINLLKDRKYLRKNQFLLWNQTEFNKDSFISAGTVVQSLTK